MHIVSNCIKCINTTMMMTTTTTMITILKNGFGRRVGKDCKEYYGRGLEDNVTFAIIDPDQDTGLNAPFQVLCQRDDTGVITSTIRKFTESELYLLLHSDSTTVLGLGYYQNRAHQTAPIKATHDSTPRQ